MHELEVERRAAAARRTATGGGENANATDVFQAVAARRADAIGHPQLQRLQGTIGNAGVAQLLGDEDRDPGFGSPIHDVVGRGGGRPLDEGTRASMESSFGTDFGDVRLHTDTHAARSASAISAHAYTVGADVVLGPGVDPGSSAGRRTIAHELAHVVQQRTGPVDGTEMPGGIRVSDPGDRFEQAAERTADAVMAAAPVVQRQGDEEEEELPTQALQREAADEDQSGADDAGCC